VVACERCGAEVVPNAAQLEKYPGWAPRLCTSCWRAERDDARGTKQTVGSAAGASRGAGGGRSGAPRTSSASRSADELHITLEEVLSTYHAGPDSGVFTDGSASPNPGPGGWGAVYVVEGVIIAQQYGSDPATTNNRMELTALLHGVDLVPVGTPAVLHTDSKLCVDTLTTWAAGWERRGWTRKTGPIANLDLVRPLYEALTARPELQVAWVKAHIGQLWNEYADALATAWMRDQL